MPSQQTRLKCMAHNFEMPKWEPMGATGNQHGSKRSRKGAKREPKGAKREPKGAKKEPKINQQIVHKKIIGNCEN